MNTLWQVLLLASFRTILIALVVGGVLAALRVRSSSLRHTAWLGVLCAMLLMPVLPLVIPAVPVPVAVPVMDDARFELAPLPPVPDERRTEPVVAEPPARQESRPAFDWGLALFSVYAAGVVALLLRLLAGWFAIRRVVRSSAPIPGRTRPLYESEFIATPVTVGILKPRVLLPRDWSSWPQEKLGAVLAHEMAHVARHDTLTGFLAQLNCCVFWFHPLAWWLRARLALTAECACDDAAVRTLGARQEYAAMLVDIAEAVRREGRRVSWQATGVAGTGFLARRIDRILQGGPVAAVRGSRTLMTALGCGLVILIVVACRERSLAPLKPDPALSETRTSMKANADSKRELEAMTLEQVADLERLVKEHPENIDVRQKLIRFYQTLGRKQLGDDRTREAFRTHKLWFIREHPENEYARFANPVPDPAGYEEERKLWRAVAEKKDAPTRAIYSAAQFFMREDPQLAEKLYLRARAAEPQGNGGRSLGPLYATVLLGPAAQTPFGKDVRDRLDHSTDAVLLQDVGTWIGRERGYRPASADKPELAKHYLERALQLNPALPTAHMELLFLKRRDLQKQIYGIEKQSSPDGQYKAVGQLPEAERFLMLPQLAQDAYWHGDSLDYYKHDPAGARGSWELARQYARDALELATTHRYRDDANKGTAIYEGNIVMGMVAMRVDGDKKTAKKCLLAASQAPPTEEVQYLIDGLTQKLCVLLLRYGGSSEREAVIDFLEREGKVVKRRDADYLHAAQQLRQGYMPFWYEWQAAQLR